MAGLDLSSHNADYDEFSLLEYNTMYSFDSQVTF
jgi:hypothetical protein